MKNVMFGVLVLVSLLGFVGAGSSSVDVVEFSVNPYSEFENNSFEGYVRSLDVESRDEDSIFWTWENGEDEGFFYNLIFLDRILVVNGTIESFEASGLDEDECVEISIVSIGVDGSEGPRVSDVGCSVDGRDRGQKVKENVIPSFFVRGDDVVIESVVIALSSEDDFREFEIDLDWLVLFCWILSLLIFVLLVLIFNFSRR